MQKSNDHYNGLGEKFLWLLFIATVPGKSTTPRIRLWRALKGMGAEVLRDGVYLLPAYETLHEALLEQAVRVRELDGTAYVFEVETEPGDETEPLIALFDRSEGYAPILEAVARFRSGLPELAETPARQTLRQLERDLNALRAIDFFPGSSLAQAEQALAEAEEALTRQLSPDEPHSRASALERRDRSDYQGRVWATRVHLWVDRVASAWLIRHFIDADARFMWLKKPEDCPPDALGFDFDGATFSHIGERVTFEVLLASFALDTDPGLARLGALVHYLDVGGVPVPEAEGFETILTGVREHSPDDNALLTAMSPILNALYTAFARAVIESD